MKTISFSKNAKLNKVLNNIYIDLLQIRDTERESIAEIKHFKNSFPKEIDFNLYQYGCMLIANNDIISLYSDYKSLQRASIEKLINIYKRQIRYVANYILSNN